jgi:peptide/nickel transport system permease protein
VGAETRSLWNDAGAHLRRDRVTLVALSIIGLYVGLALLGDVIISALGVSATHVDLPHRFEAPSAAHLLGTDDFGRDQLARLLQGARVSLGVGSAAALINLAVGVSLGATAAMYAGRADDLFTWLVNTMRSIPALFLLLIVAAIFRVGPLGLALIIGLTSWMGPSRLVRGQTLEVKAQEFIIAARSVGATNARVMLRHVGPNLVPIVSVLIGIDVGQAILRESALSYLGLGIQPPEASWGSMLTNAQSYFSRAPWLVIAPGAAITLVVWCLYAVGDGLRDALDPRITRRG